MSKASLDWESVSCDLEPWILKAVEYEGFAQMTPVQATTIPLFVGNKDVVVEAVTGSGKTIAFAIPILQRICRLFKEDQLSIGQIAAVVVAPTRELALQINSVFQNFLQYYPEDSKRQIVTQPIVGSLNAFQEDVQTFSDTKPQILISTPGKLLEFLKIAIVKKRLRDFDCLVLDEADRLLDSSFESTIREIVRNLPRQKRIGLFSATIEAAGDMIFKVGMSNPVKVKVNSKVATPKALSIYYLTLKSEDKIKKLFMILAEHDFNKAIVYFPTCIGVSYFYSMFKHLLSSSSAKPVKFFSIHGKLPLKARMRTLEGFSNNKEGKSVLMATDVAARGIDIPDVDLVIQIDPPTDPDVFLHRCGRTGRANKVGKAIVMLNEGREEGYIDFMRVKKVQLDPYEEEEEEEDDENLDTELSISYGFKNKLEKIVEKWILADRARYDLSVISYVGYIKYYSHHNAKSIFRMESLDYIGVAKAYGLIRLPRMPETKNISPEVLEKYPDGWFVEGISLDTYKYGNEQKEASRLEELAKATKKQEEKMRKAEKRKMNQAWSDKTSTKENKIVRKEKSKRIRDTLEKAMLEKDSSDEDEQNEVDWKQMVVKKKKSKKNQGAVFGDFDGL